MSGMRYSSQAIERYSSITYTHTAKTGKEGRQANKRCCLSDRPNKQESDIKLTQKEAIYTNKYTQSLRLSVVPLVSHLCAERLMPVVREGYRWEKATHYRQHRTVNRWLVWLTWQHYSTAVGSIRHRSSIYSTVKKRKETQTAREHT